MVKHSCWLDRFHCLLKPGFLSCHLESFLRDLERRGYTALTAKGYADSVCHFAHWAQRRHLGVEALSDQELTRFGRHRCRCPGGRRQDSVSPKYVRRVRRFVRYLRAEGLITTAAPRPSVDTPTPLADEFVQWLLEHRGIGAITVRHYREELAKLPRWLTHAETDLLTASCIRALVLKRAKQQSGAVNRIMIGRLRMYLRFLAATGRCNAGLEGAVPSMPCWRLSSLPRYLPGEQVERLIRSCDTRTLLGTRDRAVLLLLARLGLRAGDIADLRLQDVDWREGRLKVCGKGRREVWLPLPQDVGEAILKYLKKRSALAIEQVFLCVQAPFRSINSGVISSIVDHALSSAGIENPPSRGALLLRHSAATSMLRGGATLDAVSAMLRHRSLDMTVYYAKVDLPMLECIVQPWPEGASC
jgi:site-specific recombinase XerD